MPSRRTLLKGLGGMTTIATAGCLGRSGGETCPDGNLADVSGSWTTRGGTPGHSNATDAGGFETMPETRWCTELEGRLTSLVLAEGSLYAFERVGDLGDRTFYLQANNAGDGSERWRRPLPEKPIAEAAVAEGGIYVTMESNDADVVARYAARDGSEDWAIEFPPETDSMPAVSNGNAYVVDVAGEVYAYDAAGGRERWSTKVSQRIDPALNGNVPAIAEGTVYVGTAIGTGPAALDTADGSVRWQRDLPDFFHPIADGNTLLGTDEEVLYALDPATGETRWKLDAVGSRSPALDGDTVYAVSSDGVTAYAAADGSKQWTSTPPDAIGNASGVVATDGTLLVNGSEGIVGIDASSGEKRWIVEMEVDRFIVGDGVAFTSNISDRLRGLAFA